MDSAGNALGCGACASAWDAASMQALVSADKASHSGQLATSGVITEPEVGLFGNLFDLMNI